MHMYIMLQKLTTRRKLGQSSLRDQGMISLNLWFWYNKMSSFNWNQIVFNLSVYSFRAWMETIILAANNVFSFIFTSGFGDSSIFHCFRHRDLVSSLTTSYVHVLPSFPWRSEWYSSPTLCLKMSVLVLHVWGMDFMLNTLNTLIKLHTSCWKFPI